MEIPQLHIPGIQPWTSFLGGWTEPFYGKKKSKRWGHSWVLGVSFYMRRCDRPRIAVTKMKPWCSWVMNKILATFHEILVVEYRDPSELVYEISPKNWVGCSSPTKNPKQPRAILCHCSVDIFSGSQVLNGLSGASHETKKNNSPSNHVNSSSPASNGSNVPVFLGGIQTFPPNRNMKSLCQLDISCFCFTIELTSPKQLEKIRTWYHLHHRTLTNWYQQIMGLAWKLYPLPQIPFLGIQSFQGRFLHIILLLFWLVAIYFEQPEFSCQQP